ncbi:hypothetical protein [Dyella humicola]|uniref:hypothetical protein n=1 Tax=Dyella humicola TaxID=2992126 RepID=UPI002254F2E3|nr:hypothetical protein [Dyella humicola]
MTLPGALQARYIALPIRRLAASHAAIATIMRDFSLMSQKLAIKDHARLGPLFTKKSPVNVPEFVLGIPSETRAGWHAI